MFISIWSTRGGKIVGAFGVDHVHRLLEDAAAKSLYFLLHLSRSRPILQGTLCQNQRLALTLGAASGPSPLVQVPWAGRIMGLPFLTLLAPSARFHAGKPRASKILIDWARQAALQIHRWLPDRSIVMVADSAFAAIELLAAVGGQICVVTRLRLDANIFASAQDHAIAPRTAAWYPKTNLTFSDAIAAVRRRLWAQQIYSTSPQTTEIIKIPRRLADRMANALAYAA